MVGFVIVCVWFMVEVWVAGCCFMVVEDCVRGRLCRVYTLVVFLGCDCGFVG